MDFFKGPLSVRINGVWLYFQLKSRVELFVSWSDISTTWAEVIIRVKRGVYCLSVESDWLFGELSSRVVMIICSLFPLGESEKQNLFHLFYLISFAYYWNNE